MQQNLRAAADILTREIRMAGYDPTGDAEAEITTLGPGQFSFSFDGNEDGDISDTGEIIDFGFSAAAGNDTDRNGIPDTLTAGVPNALSMGRQTGGAGGYQAIAENFQAIEFHYLDEDGNEQTLASDQYRVVTAGEPGYLELADGCSWPSTQSVGGAVRIVFSAGYGATAASVPEGLRLAIMMLATHWYGTGRDVAVVGTTVNEVPMTVRRLLDHYETGWKWW